MAKKRKASAREQAGAADSGAIDPRDSRKKIRTYEDVAGSDDEFHLNNDRVLLEESADAQRRRKWKEKEEFLEVSDEEVLGYSEDEDEADEDDSFATAHSELQKTPGGRPSGRAEPENGDEDEDDDEDLRWGMNKADIYGADAIETEEQAIEEEAEARRLQKKQLEAMNAADYGFDEDEWGAEGKAPERKKTGGNVITEVLPQLQLSQNMSAVDRLKVLNTRYPEFTPLRTELLELQKEHFRLSGIAPTSTTVRTKLRAASAYLGVLTVYFSLLTSPAADGEADVVALSTSQLREHPIMDSLVDCRTLWLTAKQLSERVAVDSASLRSTGELATDDEDDEDFDADSIESDEDDETEVTIKPADPRADQKRERLRRTEAGLEELDHLLSSSRASNGASKSRKVRSKGVHDDSDLGEEAILTAREAEDKAKRKKSLRFYASQISQKANKRGTAGRNAGGDDDIPYRERLRDRQARLNAEAEKRGRRENGADTDLGAGSDDEDHQKAKQIREDEDDYYDFIAARTAKKKTNRAALADAQRQAATQGGHVVQEETVDADGKRRITYAIEKNKGLTPHRRKELRNPRVKKRMKFDEKKKKLASMKAVYKGGEGRGGYGGELTGIKTGLVKSVKL